MSCVVIRDLEKFWILTEITILPIFRNSDFPGFHILPPLKEFRPEIYTHIYIQSHAYVTVIYHSMTNPRTFGLKEERISGMHCVLMFPCCLLHSSVLPQHIYYPHSFVSQNLLSAIHNTHKSLLEGPICINNKLAPVHYMSWV